MAASLLTQMGGQASARPHRRLPPAPQAQVRAPPPRRVAELLGVDVPEAFVEDVLGRLGFRVETTHRGAWRVEVPFFRVDIEREADLIEEVARFYGYDRIPSAVTPVGFFELTVNRKRDRVGRIRQTLLGQGFDEVINWSFADPGAGGGRERAACSRSDIRNPISNRASVLRTTLLAGLLENAAWNLNRGSEGVHVFEVGNVYSWNDDKHREDLRLGLLSTGLLPGAGWPRPRRRRISTSSRAPSTRWRGAALRAHRVRREGPPLLRRRPGPGPQGQGPGGRLPGRPPGGSGGRLFGRPDRLRGRDRPRRPVRKTPNPFQVSPVPKFPAAIRDLSFLLDRGVPYREVVRVVDKLNLPLLEGFELRDRFAGPSIPADKVSLTVRFRFRHPQGTLVAEEVDRVEQEITGHLKTALNIQLREGKIDNRT